MTSQLPSRCLLSVETEADATVAARILHLLTVRGEIPEGFSVRKTVADALRIAVEMAGLDAASADSIKQKLLKLPTVVNISTAWLRVRDQVLP